MTGVKMKVLVTGGAGFIGSAVCRYLIGEIGVEVLNVDKLTYAANPKSLELILDSPLYHFLRADISDADAMELAFSSFAPDAVIHLAAESHVDRSITSSDIFVQTNIVGTYTLLKSAMAYWRTAASAANFRFLHVSTDEVYGSLDGAGYFTELTPYDPSSPYSASKAAADHLAMAWHRTYGLPVIISNCSNNYGPYQFPEKLVPLTILNAIDGNPLPVYGDGQNVRDWLHVEDHARALYALLVEGRPGEKYNVGARNEKTNLSLVESICTIMDVYRPKMAPHHRLITFVTDRPGHDRRYAIDAGKLQSELDWHPIFDFESGLEETVRWYIENRNWWEPLRHQRYKGERLGLLEESMNA
jgi:dTDP-glucose 4,6-dehydratase